MLILHLRFIHRKSHETKQNTHTYIFCEEFVKNTDIHVVIPFHPFHKKASGSYWFRSSHVSVRMLRKIVGLNLRISVWRNAASVFVHPDWITVGLCLRHLSLISATGFQRHSEKCSHDKSGVHCWTFYQFWRANEVSLHKITDVFVPGPFVSKTKSNFYWKKFTFSRSFRADTRGVQFRRLFWRFCQQRDRVVSKIFGSMRQCNKLHFLESREAWRFSLHLTSVSQPLLAH